MTFVGSALQTWIEARRSTFMNPVCSVTQLTFHNKLEYYSTEYLHVPCKVPNSMQLAMIDCCVLAHAIAYSHENNRHVKSPVTCTLIWLICNDSTTG